MCGSHRQRQSQECSFGSFEVELTNSTKHKAQLHIQARRWKRKMTAWSASTTKTAKRSYDPESVDVTESQTNVIENKLTR